ncbi:hypothetical protein [Methylobacter marinus]|uniref:hypothetical protein n=1 Tax=Methylobacter marinus TaxID=34058 RepID=UPI00039F54FD|nr:hypothetical protein [Methylobacter marinus]
MFDIELTVAGLEANVVIQLDDAQSLSQSLSSAVIPDPSGSGWFLRLEDAVSQARVAHACPAR